MDRSVNAYPPIGGGNEVALARLDKWAERSHWLPEQDQRFPASAFWGIFIWNLPILFLALGVIGFALYRTEPEPSGYTGLPWVIEVLLASLALAFTIDFIGCLWLRRAWNRRARFLNSR